MGGDMMPGGYQKETITVIAKTYPECSKKYGCLVCTAGINDKGEWRRLYPIPWSLFWGRNANPTAKGFQTFDVISLPIIRKFQDSRTESYYLNPHTIQDDLQVVAHVHGWNERQEFLSSFVDPNLESLRRSKRSLGIIKPKDIQDFVQRDRNRLEPGEELTIEKIEQAQQGVLFDVESELVKQSRTPPQALPWIGYRFTCEGPNCRGHKMMCIEWGIQNLYRRFSNDGSIGFQKVKDRAMNWMSTRDVYFVVGTTWRFESWMIIGVFYPPKGGARSESQVENLRLL